MIVTMFSSRHSDFHSLGSLYCVVTNTGSCWVPCTHKLYGSSQSLFFFSVYAGLASLDSVMVTTFCI